VVNNSEENQKARSRTFFAGISLKELFSTGEEWHAFLIGFFEVLCPWPARHPMKEDYLFRIENEHHYYLGGRASGVIAWLIIARLIQVIFW